MKKLEEIRLEVDSRRRTVADLSAKVEKQRARLPQTRAKGEDEMQNTIKTMQHKENKLAGVTLAHVHVLILHASICFPGYLVFLLCSTWACTAFACCLSPFLTSTAWSAQCFARRVT